MSASVPCRRGAARDVTSTGKTRMFEILDKEPEQ
jgi:hypothetical protein